MNDLKLAVDVLLTLEVPFGVVINKYDASFKEMENYLVENGIEILLNIPFDRKIAEMYSEGIPPVKKIPELKNEFLRLYEKIKEKVESISVE